MPLTLNLVTDRILQCAYPTDQDLAVLTGLGFTDFLSLSAKHSCSADFLDGDPVFHHFPISDMKPLSYEEATELTGSMNRILSRTFRKLCVYCSAGKVRSPTTVWLFLVATGHSMAEATEMVSKGNRVLVVPNQLLISELDLTALRQRSSLERPRSGFHQLFRGSHPIRRVWCHRARTAHSQFDRTCR